MRASKPVVLILAMLLLAAPATAQEEDPGRVTKVFRMNVEPGDTLHFETAFREHLKVGAENNEPWAWHTWQIVNGKDFGQFMVRSYGHQWQDFDERAEHNRLAVADFMANVAPHLKSISSTIEVVEPALSNWPADRGRPALVEMTQFELTYEGVREFVVTVEKIHEAMLAKDPSRHYVWFSTVNGARGPTMTLGVPHDNWADFKPDKRSLWDIVAEVYGDEEAQAMRTTLGSCIRSESSLILRLRQDLSYEPK